ncbi:nucleoside diphosphate-linked moiety X motif 17 isoform X2 [Cherax quadricarinatus]|uniref:nucleoside diphosphate-linked moiety X motif 17 isoform X2 n=1 Tax=Cherax quadricarinatus TaxID=27406 RepID=UPI002377E1A0|nr:nucleoside diphosphate-linked moiety X motif 17-like isoform X2 [Cherax quadricarinatus]
MERYITVYSAMANTSLTRVLVHLRKTSNTAYKTAKFNECVLDQLGLPGDGFVECSLENNQLFIQCPDLDKSKNAGASTIRAKLPALYKIMHPPFCPIQHLDKEGSAALPLDIATRGVDVGVAVLLESSDKCLLLTRRAKHMRTFAGVWVPPGGHVEEGENLEDAALRELMEETGLVITAEEYQSVHILGLWESVFPPLLSMGQPRRHHIVVYLHIVLQRASEELQKEFKLCPEEVDAAVWLSVDLIKLSVWKTDSLEEQDQNQGAGKASQDEKIHVTLVNKFGEHASGSIESSVLRNIDQANELNLERLSTGSRFALSLWLEQHLKDSSLLKTSQMDLYKDYFPQNESEDIASLQKLKPKI